MVTSAFSACIFLCLLYDWLPKDYEMRAVAGTDVPAPPEVLLGFPGDCTGADEPPLKVVCGSRKGSPKDVPGIFDDMDAVLINPQYPYPARSAPPLHVIPQKYPLGSVWESSIQCGPPLIVPEGFELAMEELLAPQPEFVPQQPVKRPQPTALVSRWAIDPLAAMRATKGPDPSTRKPPKPRRSTKTKKGKGKGKGKKKSNTAAARNAKKAKNAVANIAEKEEVAVSIATPGLAGTSHDLGLQGSCDLNMQFDSPALEEVGLGGGEAQLLGRGQRTKAKMASVVPTPVAIVPKIPQVRAYFPSNAFCTLSMLREGAFGALYHSRSSFHNTMHLRKFLVSGMLTQ
jgi:hypothetical protein